MKELLLANCEKSFISDCISNKKRLDGRTLDAFRPVRINFGSEWGSVHVSLGETRVLAQVTCEVTQPKSTRPAEGIIYLNVELGPMAAPNFEGGRSSNESVQINRILERAFKDSRCIDLEGLCIVAEEKVWSIRVDLNVLNHEGNIIDCASIAALSALAHFKVPDVTTSGVDVIIHTYAEKDPIPITLHHYPVCVSYAIFNKGEIAIADPTAIEERISEAIMVLGLNSYRELCGLHLGGITLTSPQLIIKYANNGANRACKIVEQIKEAIKEDMSLRENDKPVGFTECIRLNKITTITQDRISVKLNKFQFDKCLDEVDDNFKHKVVNINNESAVLLPIDEQPEYKWIPELDESDDSNIDGDIKMEPTNSTNAENKNTIEKPPEPTNSTNTENKNTVEKPPEPIKMEIENSSEDSEEEETIMLE